MAQGGELAIVEPHLELDSPPSVFHVLQFYSGSNAYSKFFYEDVSFGEFSTFSDALFVSCNMNIKPDV